MALHDFELPFTSLYGGELYSADPRSKPPASSPSAEETCLSLGAVVVLYDPSSEQLARLPALGRQCARVVVVDNSPDARPEQHRSLQAAGLTVIVNGNAGGIAGALNRGLAWLDQQEVDAFLLLDQDSVLPPGYAAGMSRAAREVGSSFILGPRVFDVNARDFLPTFALSRFAIRRIEMARVAVDARVVRCAFVISSGSLVSREAYRTLGKLREDFVIDHVDTDYCLRAADRGVTVACVAGLTLHHAIGRRQVRRVLGMRVGVMNHDARRRYYLARNGLALIWLHGARFPVVAAVNMLTFSQCIAVLLFESDKARKLLALGCGIVDGLRRRSGPFETLHPRLAARIGPTGSRRPPLSA